jgi:hypothetical protein
MVLWSLSRIPRNLYAIPKKKSDALEEKIAGRADRDREREAWLERRKERKRKKGKIGKKENIYFFRNLWFLTL